MPTTSTIIAVADAVTALLNAPGAFSPVLNAVRRFRPRWTIKDLATLRVTVVPMTRELRDLSRGTVGHDIQIDVGIQKYITDEENSTLDELMELVEEITLYLNARENRTLPAYPAATLKKIENAPIYSPEQIEDLHVFTSLITLTYTAVG